MAFASTIEYRTKAGDMTITMGTYTSNSSSTGGDIDTGLVQCRNIVLTPNDSSVEASAPVVNETLPVAGNAVTIVTIADEVGYWVAYGI